MTENNVKEEKKIKRGRGRPPGSRNRKTIEREEKERLAKLAQEQEAQKIEKMKKAEESPTSDEEASDDELPDIEDMVAEKRTKGEANEDSETTEEPKDEEPESKEEPKDEEDTEKACKETKAVKSRGNHLKGIKKSNDVESVKENAIWALNDYSYHDIRTEDWRQYLDDPESADPSEIFYEVSGTKRDVTPRITIYGDGTIDFEVYADDDVMDKLQVYYESTDMPEVPIGRLQGNIERYVASARKARKMKTKKTKVRKNVDELLQAIKENVDSYAYIFDGDGVHGNVGSMSFDVYEDEDGYEINFDSGKFEMAETLEDVITLLQPMSRARKSARKTRKMKQIKTNKASDKPLTKSRGIKLAGHNGTFRVVKKNGPYAMLESERYGPRAYNIILKGHALYADDVDGMKDPRAKVMKAQVEEALFGDTVEEWDADHPDLTIADINGASATATYVVTGIKTVDVIWNLPSGNHPGIWIRGYDEGYDISMTTGNEFLPELPKEVTDKWDELRRDGISASEVLNAIRDFDGFVASLNEKDIY